ncbi:type II toxin-antitoxin system RelE/ParE family toxin [Prosthecobacter sp.]|uniref:type II toxin-antitoxin system RelE/ParE family toxin n=1 Tax=Prosthecobacter sp. TaxID=1965333 RepID=UPI0024883E40|nr:type II toxin-antitoxin system RelE/ParE family toxin [Prosthecobacter sp.]MDI1314598.1 type II toxin-antitoxin system RelE/ParE family toxin [Prosthecobacter sp.]
MFDPVQHMHPDVGDVDLVEIAEHIALDDPEAARRVVSAIRDMFILLAHHSLLGTEYHPLRRSLQDIRMITVPEYPNYLIYYRPLPENAGARILYLLHGARDAAAFAKEHHRQ